MTIRKGRNVRVFGHFWKWVKPDPASAYKIHWISTKGNEVRIFPPIKRERNFWIVMIDIHTEKSVFSRYHKQYRLGGKSAKVRAFAVAEALTRQE